MAKPSPEDYALWRLDSVARIITAIELLAKHEDRENAMLYACNEWIAAFNRYPEMAVSASLAIMKEQAMVIAAGLEMDFEDYIRHMRMQAAKTVQ